MSAVRRETAAVYMHHLQQHLQLIEANTRSLCNLGITTEERKVLCAVRDDLARREHDIRSYLATALEDPAERRMQQLIQTMCDLTSHIVHSQ
jgi:hypothetical protein